MKSLWHKIAGGLTRVSEYLVTLGPAGLFAVALLDSVFVPLPGGPDAVMLLLSTQRPALMPVYALAATSGSVVGCLILYYISRRAGRRALDRFPASKQAQVKELIDRYDVLSVLVACLLPPPFPFKLFVVSAGVFRLNVWRFIAAIAAGRAFRYFLEGFFAVEYGERAGNLLAQNYPAVGIGLAALIVVFFLLRSFLRGRKREVEGQAAPVAGDSDATARGQVEAEDSTGL
ncbi:MAG TPA: VTT domain-containing protein [Pyrinomonadaceae bacterium]|nr:VTT domain-containing protein [Pyrinomonadaceae bacterium]